MSKGLCLASCPCRNCQKMCLREPDGCKSGCASLIGCSLDLFLNMKYDPNSAGAKQYATYTEAFFKISGMNEEMRSALIVNTRGVRKVQAPSLRLQ